MRLRAQQAVDVGAYFRAFALYARNPWIVVPPFLTGLIGFALTVVFTPSGRSLGGSLTGGIMGLFVTLLDFFGLAVSVIIADLAWRRGRGPLGEAWDDARRKAGDILMASLGFTFIVYVAGVAGSFVGLRGLSLVLSAVAAYFLIYTIPAAAIGGIPGGAALQISIERVQRGYLGALLLGIVFLLFTVLFATVYNDAVNELSSLSTFFASPLAVAIVGTAIKAIGLGYVALVMAKSYNDVSYGRRY
jgi:hypothetical protein